MNSPKDLGELVELISQKYTFLKTEVYKGKTKKAFSIAISEAVGLYGLKFEINNTKQMVAIFNKLHKPKDTEEDQQKENEKKLTAVQASLFA